MSNPDVFTKETHAETLLEQIDIDFPEVEDKDKLVEFVMFLMNRSYWEGAATALAVIKKKPDDTSH